MLRKEIGRIIQIVLISALLTSSCATVFNKRYSTVAIKTSERVNFIYNQDTLINRSDIAFEGVFINDKDPLRIDYFNENHRDSVYLNAIRSKLFYLNVFTPYWLGFVVDEINTKKWDYPRRVYIDVEKGTYLPYFPLKEEDLLKHRNKFSINPFSTLGNQHPGVEVAFQRNLNERFAIQASFESLISADSEIAQNTEGFVIGGELKYFLRNTLNSRFYVSMNFEHLNKRHVTSLTFSEPSDDFSFEPPLLTQSTNIQKHFYSLVPRFGIEYYLGKRFILDSYIGVGPRHRIVKHLDAPEGLVYYSLVDDWFSYNYESNREARNFSANFDLNFRIGFLF